MLRLFGKNKLKENIVANVFVNLILDIIDKGFVEVAGLINESPEFIAPPNIDTTDDNAFALIVIAANLHCIPVHLHDSQDKRIIELILSKFSKVFDCNQEKLKTVVKEYQDHLISKNLPSKNIRYALSKSLFWKYNLNDCQDEYFKNMESPNPMFLKRLDEALYYFIWDWDAFKQEYQIV